jgi:hypothetical protein
MIFLAISGLLFATAVVAVGGNQQRVQYSQAVRDFETQIKDVMNDVSNGFYPKYNQGECERSATNTVQFTPAATSSPGSNQECINVGKVIMPNLGGDDENFGVGTIVGLSPGLGATVDLSLVNLAPTLAYSTVDPVIDLTTSKPIRFGARITKIASMANPSATYSSLSFISNFSSSLNSTYENGTLSTSVYGLKGALKTGTPTIGDYINDVEDDLINPADVDVNLPGGYYICLITTDNKRARVVIGGNGVVTSTRSEFDLDAGAICP